MNRGTPSEPGASLIHDPDRALELVAIELRAARERFAPFNSPHEGWAVIREELDELWEHVRANTGSGMAARKEAIQIAAMALRYALDCADEAEIERDLQRDLGSRSVKTTVPTLG